MRPLLLYLAVGCGFALAQTPGEQPQKVDDDKVVKLVKQLGSDVFAIRVTAMKALDEMGAPALPALRIASKGPDTEATRRARELVDKIETRIETAELLAPKTLRLAYKDTPLKEAVADIAKQSGYTITLGASDLADRKITLDTGATTFWEALDQFCAKAGLNVASTPPPTPAIGGGGAGGGPRVINLNKLPNNAAIKGGAIEEQPLPKAAADRKPNEIRLIAGDTAAKPTSLAGSFRVRALPGANGELRLEVLGEPRIQVQNLRDVVLKQAVDDQDQIVKRLPPKEQPNVGGTFGGGNIAIAGNGFNGVFNGGGKQGNAAPPQQISVRFAPGEIPAKALKELTGTVLVDVKMPPKPLVTVDQVLKAENKTFPGSAGSSVKVISIKTEDDGNLRIRLQVQAPALAGPPVNPFNPPGGIRMMQNINGNIIINGVPVGMAPKGIPLAAEYFSLLDKQGKPLERVNAVKDDRANPPEIELVFRPAAGQEADRLVFSGPRTMLLEVPFSLKDVPLP